MLLEWVTASAAVLLTVWLYHRKKKPKKEEIQLTICTPSWSPLNILWIDTLPPLSMSICSDSYQKNDSISDQCSWCVAPDNEFPPTICKQFYHLPCPSNSETDIISEKSLQFALSPPSREECDSENGTVGLRGVSPPPNGVLQRRDTNPLMTVSSEGLV